MADKTSGEPPTWIRSIYPIYARLVARESPAEAVEWGQRVAAAGFPVVYSAEAYIEATDLSSDWKSFCPGRSDLLEVLRQSTSAGIDLAVLDPDAKEAKRIFDLREVVQTMQE